MAIRTVAISSISGYNNFLCKGGGPPTLSQIIADDTEYIYSAANNAWCNIQFDNVLARDAVNITQVDIPLVITRLANASFSLTLLSNTQDYPARTESGEKITFETSTDLYRDTTSLTLTIRRTNNVLTRYDYLYMNIHYSTASAIPSSAFTISSPSLSYEGQNTTVAIDSNWVHSSTSRIDWQIYNRSQSDDNQTTPFPLSISTDPDQDLSVYLYSYTDFKVRMRQIGSGDESWSSWQNINWTTYDSFDRGRILSGLDPVESEEIDTGLGADVINSE